VGPAARSCLLLEHHNRGTHVMRCVQVPVDKVKDAEKAAKSALEESDMDDD
jgi:hypothetical protein